MGRRKGRGKVKGRLLNVSSNGALEKKDLGFDSCCSCVSSRYEDVLSACPSVQECKGKGWNTESLCSRSSRSGRQMGRAGTLAVSCKIVTVPLHAWS